MTTTAKHPQTTKDMRKLEKEGNYMGRIDGCNIYSFDAPKFHVAYIAKMAVCCDGSGKSHGDPCYQSETAYYNNGKFLNADKVPYVVVPPKIRYGVEPTVMGCMSMACNLANGLVAQAIVGDEGPEDEIGEGSCCLCYRLGLSPNPNNGGTDDHIILYILFPGIPATVDGTTYKLQPS